MTIVEIIRFYNLRAFTPYSAFVYACLPARRTTAQWWLDMGAPADDSTLDINIGSLLVPPNTFYSKQSSLADCLTQERSFYWDSANQVLYIHVAQTIIPAMDSFSSGVTFGYTDSDIVYIGRVLYKPLLKAIPSLSAQADLASYDKMAFVAGRMILDNTEGGFDDVIDDAIYGNDVYTYYLDGSPGIDYERTDLVPLQSFYVEDYGHTLKDFTVKLQDRRKSQNINVLSVFLASGKPVPLVYGAVRGLSAVVTDDSSVAVEFRAAVLLTSFGTIQCEGEFGWSTVTPISSSLATGTFVLSAAYARAPGNGLGEDDGRVLPCRLVNPIGIVNANALEVIEDLNERVLGIEYNSSNYNTTEWEAAEAVLCAIGVAFTKQLTVYEAIAMIQRGCNVGFRYEIDATGLRTVRLDDWSSAAVAHVSWYDIKDNLTMAVQSDSSVLAAVARVEYAPDYSDDSVLSYEDDSQRQAVLLRYRQEPTLTVEAFMTAEADAIERAAYTLERFAIVPRMVGITLHGVQWYGLRIYDMLTIELGVPETMAVAGLRINAARAYYGTWKAQVLAIDPGFDDLTNTIRAVLVERI